MTSMRSVVSAKPLKPQALLVGLVILVLFLIYGPSVFNNDYAWDDWELFINSPYLRNPSLVFEGLVKPILPGTTYFRPLPLATFALEFIGGSVNPILSHSVNFLIHGVNTFLVAYIFSKMFLPKDGKIDWYRPILAAAIYGVHPALVESVAWAAGRFDLLVTLFYLAAIAVYLRFPDPLRIFLLFPVYLAACFSKEMAITLPVSLLIIEFYRVASTEEWRARIFKAVKNAAPSILILCAAGVLYIIAKFHFMGKIAHVDVAVMSEFRNGSLDHLGFVGQTFIFYIKMMFWPFASLSPHHPFEVSKITGAQIAGGLFASAAILIGLAYFALKRSAPAICFSLAVLCLFPVLNIIPLTIGGNIGHERFLTLPLAFLAMGIAVLPLQKIASFSGSHRIFVPTAFGIVGIWLVLAILNTKITAPLWQSDLTLWKWAFETNPRFYVANIGYAGAAVRYQEFDLAEKILTHSKSIGLKGDENRLPAAILEARLLGRKGKFAEAVSVLEQSRENLISQYLTSVKKVKEDDLPIMGPRLNSIYYTALTEAYVGQGGYFEAQKSGELAISYAPKYSLAWLQLSLASYGLDDWEAGEKEFLTSKDFIVNTGASQIDEMRSSFLIKLCANQTSHPNVCGKFDGRK